MPARRRSGKGSKMPMNSISSNGLGLGCGSDVLDRWCEEPTTLSSRGDSDSDSDDVEFEVEYSDDEMDDFGRGGADGQSGKRN